MNRKEFLQAVLASFGFGVSGALTAATSSSRGETENGPLADWQQRPFLPLSEDPAPVCAFLRDAIRAQARLTICYHGGSAPGGRREITPLLIGTRPTLADIADSFEWHLSSVLVKVTDHPVNIYETVDRKMLQDPAIRKAVHETIEEEAHVYIHAWCHLREAGRWFRVDRLEIAEFPGLGLS